MISWMEGFRNAYQMPKIWGLVKERMIAFLLVVLAGLPMVFASFLLVFGNQIERWTVYHVGHELGPYILGLWTAVRWIIAALTSIAVIGADLSPRRAAHAALASRAAWRGAGDGAVVRVHGAVRRLSAALCELRCDLRLGGNRHRVADLAVPGVDGGADRGGV